jgi:hypothetical protein
MSMYGTLSWIASRLFCSVDDSLELLLPLSSLGVEKRSKIPMVTMVGKRSGMFCRRCQCSLLPQVKNEKYNNGSDEKRISRCRPLKDSCLEIGFVVKVWPFPRNTTEPAQPLASCLFRVVVSGDIFSLASPRSITSLNVTRPSHSICRHKSVLSHCVMVCCHKLYHTAGNNLDG